jgi:hypothetical protein
MHWVLQENVCNEAGYADMIALLERFDIPHSIHKVIPFIGELLPDIELPNPVICYGSYSMRRVAVAKGWTPGVFDLEPFTYQEQIKHWPHKMLNADSEFGKFGDLIPTPEVFFARPVADSKYFAGRIFDKAEWVEWQGKVRDLGEDDGSGLRADTMVMACEPKRILREYRFWIVDKKVITGSLYKMGDRVVYDKVIDKEAETFAWACVAPMSLDCWNPLSAFVLDIALLPDNQYKIVEINTINAAGLYAADVGKLVSALEDLGNRTCS